MSLHTKKSKHYKTIIKNTIYTERPEADRHTNKNLAASHKLVLKALSCFFIVLNMVDKDRDFLPVKMQMKSFIRKLIKLSCGDRGKYEYSYIIPFLEGSPISSLSFVSELMITKTSAALANLESLVAKNTTCEKEMYMLI